MVDTEKSPCLECMIHLRGLDKLDPKYPCHKCRHRKAYAARNYGMPARYHNEDSFLVYHDGLAVFGLFESEIKIIDIGLADH